MKQLSQVILTLALLVPAFAQNKTAIAPKGTFEISGTLVDSITGQPISRARVALTPITQRDDQTTLITAEDGRFSFPNLTAGKYSLSAQAHGYLLQSFNQHDEYSSAIAVGTADGDGAADAATGIVAGASVPAAKRRRGRLASPSSTARVSVTGFPAMQATVSCRYGAKQAESEA